MNTQLPSVFNRPGIRPVGQAIAGGMGAGQHPRLSIKGQSFHLSDAGGNRWAAPIQLFNTAQGQVVTLRALIVGANENMSKVYYGGEEYIEDAGLPPICWSDNGVGPSRGAETKQARTCAECPHAGWGSAVSKMTGRPTKACNDKKKLAVLVLGDTTGLCYEFQVPPASLRALNSYQQQCAQIMVPDGSRPADVSDFVTGVSFVPGQTGLLQFTPLCWINSVYHDGQKLDCQFDPQGNPLPAADGGHAAGQAITAVWTSGQVDELVGAKDQAAVPGQLPPPAQAGYGALPAGAPAYPHNAMGGPLQSPAAAPPASVETGYAAAPGGYPQPQPGYAPPATAYGASQPAAYPPPAQAAPVNPYAGPAGAAPAQPVQAFVPSGPAPGAPQPPAAPTRRQAARRTRQEPQGGAAPGGAPAPAPTAQTPVPPFLQRQAGAAAPPAQAVPPAAVAPGPAAAPSPQPAAPVAQPANQSYGMVDPPPPPADMSAQIRQAMALSPT